LIVANGANMTIINSANSFDDRFTVSAVKS